MTTIKDNKYFYTVTIDGSLLEDIDTVKRVTIDMNSFSGEPSSQCRYTIEDNKFVANENGEWKCEVINWEKNTDKKFWQFWKDSKIYTRIVMVRTAV